MPFYIAGNDGNEVALLHFLICPMKFGIAKDQHLVNHLEEDFVNSDMQYTKTIQEVFPKS